MKNKIFLIVIINIISLFISQPTYARQIDEINHVKKVSCIPITNYKKVTYSSSDITFITNAVKKSKKRKIKIEAKSDKKIFRYIDIIDDIYAPYSTYEPPSYTNEDGVYFYLKWDDIQRFKKETNTINMELDKIIKSLNINSYTTEYDAVRKINNWICQNISYDYNYKIHEIKDILNTKTAICEGYSNLFVELCSKVGIKSHVISSTKLNHAWNEVFVDGQWYEIDTCWNDGCNTDIYFLMTKDESAYIHGSPECIKSELPTEKVNFHKISYKLKGGKNSDKNPSIYVSGISTKLHNPSKEGYEFIGWFYKRKEVKNIKNLNEDITLIAKWRKA